MQRIAPAFLQLICLFSLMLLPACVAQSTPAPAVIYALSTTPTLPVLPPTATLTAQPVPTLQTTPTPGGTQPPEGIFALKFYPPLVVEYDPVVWRDASEYNNALMMVNYLQHRALPGCSIGVMGPSGFYPSPMQRQRLDKIEYEIFRQESVQSGQTNIYYFASGASLAEIHKNVGIPVLIVQAFPEEIDQCEADAEIVLVTLRR